MSTPKTTEEPEADDTEPNTQRMWTWFVEYVTLAVALNRALLHLSHMSPTAFGPTPLNEWTAVTHTTTAAAIAFTQLLVALAAPEPDTNVCKNHLSVAFLAAYSTFTASLLAFTGDTQSRHTSALLPAELASIDAAKQSPAAAAHIAITIVLLYVTLAGSFSLRGHTHSTFIIKIILLVPPCTHWLVHTYTILKNAKAALCVPQPGQDIFEIDNIRKSAEAHSTQAYNFCACTPALLATLELIRRNAAKDLFADMEIQDSLQPLFDTIGSPPVLYIANLVEIVYVVAVTSLIVATMADSHVTGSTSAWTIAIYTAWLMGILTIIAMNLYEMAKTPMGAERNGIIPAAVKKKKAQKDN